MKVILKSGKEAHVPFESLKAGDAFVHAGRSRRDLHMKLAPRNGTEAPEAVILASGVLTLMNYDTKVIKVLGAFVELGAALEAAGA